MGLTDVNGAALGELDEKGKAFWGGFLVAGGHVTASEWSSMPAAIRSFLVKFGDDLAMKRAQDVGMAVAYAIVKTAVPKKPDAKRPEKEAASAALEEAAGEVH